MDKLSMCRICLVEDIKMCVINAKLQELFERLTKTPFVTNDKKPVQVCYLCHARLQNCYRLQAACLKSEEFLNKVIADVKLNEMELQDLNTLKIVHPLVLTSYVPSTRKDPEGDKIHVDHGVKFAQLEIIPDVQIKQEVFEDDSLNVAVDIKSEGTYKIYDVHTEESDLLDNGQTELQHGVYRKIDKIVPERTDLEHFKIDDSCTNEVINIKSEVTVEEEDICAEDGDTSYNRHPMQNTELEHVIHVKTEKIGLERIDLEQFKIGGFAAKKPQPDLLNRNTESSSTKPETEVTVLQNNNIVEKISFIEKRRKKKNPGEKRFKCDICGRSFKRKFTLLNHTRIHTGEKPFKCDMCGRSFNRKATLVNHTLNKHTGEKPFKCDICGKSYGVKSNLIEHTYEHTGEKPFKCDICDRSFIKKIGLIEHTYKHTGEKPFKCDICDKSFIQKIALIEHTYTHTGEKPFKCDMCDKSFIKKMGLIEHSYKHTGEKPFKCDICDKSFIKKMGLIEHTYIHTGEKPYKCDICNRSFSRKNNLRHHTRKHTGEKPYKCDICNKSFNSKSILVPHIRIHTGEKPFKCDICKKNFNQKSSLIRHTRIHTGEKRYR